MPSTTTSTTIETTLPRPDCCLSYWHKTTRAFPYLNADATAALPESSKYVIIGSGISGALTAFSLVESGAAGPEIVVLEAREAVSGASGRNAGHVHPDAFRGFTGYAAIHGPEQALKIVQNEKVVEFVKKHDVPCHFKATITYDVCLTEEFARYEAESFESFKQSGGDV